MFDRKIYFLSKVMSKFLVAISLLFFPNSLIFAQSPKLLDQFPKESDEFLLMRIDNLVSQLVENKNFSALIKIHNGKSDSPGLPYRYAAIMKTHLKNRSIEEDKILLQHCDDENETWFENYLVSPGDTISECKSPLIFPERTLLFDSYYYSFDYPEFERCCDIPGAEQASVESSVKAFSNLLSTLPESKAYVISYNGTNKYYSNGKTVTSLGRATAKSTKAELIKNGISDARITVVNGGYKDTYRNIELWFIPKGGETPKPKPDYFPKKMRR